MKKHNSRLQAFTITELLVGMLISSLVLTLVWNVYFFLKDYHELIQTKSNQLTELEQAKYWIKRDLQRAHSLEVKQAGLQLGLLTDTVNYAFEKEWFIRSQKGFTDSLPVTCLVSEWEKDKKYQLCLSSKDITTCQLLEVISTSEAKILALKE